MYMDVDCESNASCQNQVSRISPEDVKVIKMKETQFRGIDFHDPNEILFRFATSHFYTRERILTIESIDVIRNDKLDRRMGQNKISNGSVFTGKTDKFSSW